jgi:hypothetical protein
VTTPDLVLAGGSAHCGAVPVVEVVLVVPDAPLQLPAPQLELPVELPVVESAVAPLHEVLPVPPDVEEVLVSVVDEEPDAVEPPPHAESPRSADAATASEAFVLLFI